MSAKYRIKIKAVFLLMIFSLNIIIGFVCAAGLDMGFNSTHHHHHDDDTVAGFNAKVSRQVGKEKHHHDEELNKDNKPTGDNCCNKGVAEFSQSDKILAQIVTSGIQAPIVSIVHNFYYLTYLATTAKTNQKIQVIRRCFPNSLGIRVSIQSFQI